MSLIQSRMALDRALQWARVITFTGGVFGLGNLAYNLLIPERATFWAVGLNVSFLFMGLYGIFLWRRASRNVRAFKAQHGNDAGRQV